MVGRCSSSSNRTVSETISDDHCSEGWSCWTIYQR